MTRDRWHDDDGFAAGLEALAFGVVVFVFGTLIVINAWAVVDARFAAAAAAREAVRAVVQVEGTDLTVAQLETRALGAASQAFLAHGYTAAPTLSAASLSVTRCATVAVTIGLQVEPTVVPGLIEPGAYTVRASHAEVVDPFRSGLVGDGVADCAF